MIARSIVGVTVHDDVLRGLEITRDQPSRWGEVALPPGVIDQGAVVDATVLAASLRELWDTAGFATKRIALAIETEAATIRRVSLPAAVADDIAEAAAYDIAEILAYPAAEAVIDHAVLNADAVNAQVERSGSADEGEVDGSPIETLVVAVRRETIESFTQAAKLAGLRWVRAELAPAANVSLLPEGCLDNITVDGPPADEGTPRESVGNGIATLGAVVSIGETTTTVSVHDGEGLLFARVLMTGVGELASLSHELESQLAEVEILRTGGNASEGGSAAPSSDAPGVAVVAEGIRRTLLFHTTEIDKRPIHHVVLCGASSRASGLLERVTEALPNASVALLEHADWPTIEQPERFDTAFAVARLVLTSHSDHLRDLSLVPDSVLAKRNDTRAGLAGAVVAAVVAVVAFGSFQNRSTAIDQQEVAVEAAESAVARVRTEVARYADERSLAAEIDRRRALVTTLAADRVAVPSLIGQLAEAMPDDSVLRSLQISAVDTVAEANGGGASDGALVAIDGAAPDFDGVAEWIEGVDNSGVLTDVRLIGTSFGPYGSDEQDVAIFQATARVTPEMIASPPAVISEVTE